MMIGAIELPTLRDYRQKRKLTVYFLDMCKKVWYCCVLERRRERMSSIIEDMWNNNYFPCESGMCNTPQMQEVQKYISRHKEELEKTLSDEQKEIFEKLMDNMTEFNSHAERAIFVCGFKYGARVIAEALGEDD